MYSVFSYFGTKVRFFYDILKQIKKKTYFYHNFLIFLLYLLFFSLSLAWKY